MIASIITFCRNTFRTKSTLIALLLLAPQLLTAQSHYPGQHAGKFALADKLTPALYSFDLQQVRLLNSRFKQNMDREQAWLLAIDTRRLLHSFRTNAGVYDANEGGYFDIKKLAGWESLDCELRGHTTGHLLSALALMYAATSDDRFKLKADSLVNALAEVQQALNQNGYMSAFPQELINRNLAGKKVWAPWYTLHKLLAGLLDQYLYCNSATALQIAKGMGNWAYEKLQPVTPEQRTVMLRNEFGGINETFANLYAITGNTNYKWLAGFFYHDAMLDPLKEGRDILDKKHANTYIPKLLGATRTYELAGSGDGDSIAAFFWQTVVAHHSFATGSNSDKEKFFEPDHLSSHLTGYTGESCNVYNMLKLTRHLYSHSADIKYAEFYERALLNHILGQQDPATGMVAYFLPMLPGAYRVYSTSDSSFWCCMGTGFENFAKTGEAIYYHSADALYVNLFIASELNWQEKGLQVRQETQFPETDNSTFTITTAQPQTLTLNIRYPSWATAGAIVKVNGKPVRIQQKPGSYIGIRRQWRNGDKIEVSYPMRLRMVYANDASDVAAIAYGPVILAGAMGTAQLPARGTYSDPAKYNDYYTYQYNVPEALTTSLQIDTTHLEKSILPVKGQPLTFTTTKEGVVLKPLYDIHRQRYVVYWKLL
jgi:uncharacterized protein